MLIAKKTFLFVPEKAQTLDKDNSLYTVLTWMFLFYFDNYS